MDFSCAFQPIIDLGKKEVFSYEALARGKNNEPASYVFSNIAEKDLIDFDQKAREVAINLASKLQLSCHLNLNFIPSAFNERLTCVSDTLSYAKERGLDPKNIIIEITEKDIINDAKGFSKFITEYRRYGNLIAIDDFGAGYSGLNMLVDFLPDIIKLDINLISNIHTHGPRQALVKAIVQIASDLGIDVLAEGVEDINEFDWLRKQGINFFQGFFFAKPGFESLPSIDFNSIS
jgi:EAL domain-containing protein (putative c-di-GMP-specific phosphodiesterase class I)